MDKISFCINTTKNELNHLKLLFHSLNVNLNDKNHEILIFVENDTENNDVVNFLLSQKKYFSDLKIIKNDLPIPVGYATNINVLFEKTKHEIVSYIQADMVIGPKYDEEILKHLKPNMILSGTRCEPPLHPPGPEKHTVDFGTDPTNFKFKEFTQFAETKKIDKITNYFFAPFTLYKKCWLDIGGHDVSFRRSREDSDILWRFLLNGTEVKQCWNALVYHFTCTSSRGNDWWKNNTPEVQRRTATQMHADQIEMMKFIRKWGTFKHPSTFEEAKHYKYNIGAVVSGCRNEDAEVIVNLFPLFDKILIDNGSVLPSIKRLFDALQKPANFLFGITDENWRKYEKYYNQSKFEDVYIPYRIDTNVIVEFNIRSALSNPNLSIGLNNLPPLINENVQPEETCKFSMEDAIISVNGLENIIDKNIIANNPKFDMELEIL